MTVGTRGGRLPGSKRRGAVLSAFLLAVVAGFGVAGAAPASAAPGDAFDPADPLVFVAQQSPTLLEEAVTDSDGNVSFVPEGGVSAVTYNAISYNTADNYLYGVVNTGNGSLPAGSIIRIGQGGVLSRVGTATYPAPVGQAWNVGSFGPNGDFYVASSANATSPHMLEINPATGAQVKSIALSRQLGSADVTLANGYFWGSTNDGNGNAQLYRVNPGTGAVSIFPSPIAVADSGAGAAWTFGNGNLGFSSNGNGNVTQLSVTNPGSANPTFHVVATSPGPKSTNNDGAASPGEPTDLSIVKSGPTAVVPGTTVTYTITVTNNGPGNSSGFTMTDDVPAPLTNPTTTSPGCKIVGSTLTCIGGRTLAGDSVSYQVTASVPAGTTTAVSNSATVISNEADPTPDNNTSTHTSVPAALSIVKHAGTPADVNGDGLTDAGDTIQYTFTVTNSGQATMSGIAVDDAKAGSVTCPQPSLAPGVSEDCSADALYTITAADVTSGAATNTATATGNTPDGDPVTSPPSSTNTPTSAPAPGLTVVKSASPSNLAEYKPGQKITYSFAVTNTGNVPMNDIAIDEGAFTGSGTMSPATCPESSLGIGEQEICTAGYTLTATDVNAGSVTNTATANGTPPGQGTPVSSDPSTIVVPTPPAPGLAVVKSASPSTISKAGQRITYSFLVTNTGNVSMSDITIKDTDFSGTGNLSAIDCPKATLVAGEFETCTAQYTATQADIDAGSIGNKATADGTPPGSNTPVSSDPSTSDVTVDQTPALSVVKSADVQTVTAPGEVVTFTFTVTNTGNVTITDPSVTDSGFSGTGSLSAITCPAKGAALTPGEVEKCTATYKVTSADLASGGTLSNTATVTGTDPKGDPLPPSDPSTVHITELATAPALPVVSG